MQQVVIVHELHEGPNRELVEQLIRRGVPNGSADWLGGCVNVIGRKGRENVDGPAGSHLKIVPNSPPFADTPRWSCHDPEEAKTSGSNP